MQPTPSLHAVHERSVLWMEYKEKCVRGRQLESKLGHLEPKHVLENTTTREYQVDSARRGRLCSAGVQHKRSVFV